MLLPIARAQPSYFKDSFVLKDLLMALGTLPSNAILFTSDATSMYTNIKTDPALTAISAYLQDPATQENFPHYIAEALIAALEIVFRNNIFRFGDTNWRQISGTGRKNRISTFTSLLTLHAQRE